MDTIRWGIIGCGDVTEVKSGPGFQKAEGSELVAVMRRDADKAADYARRHGVPKWYDDASALIADADVDAVYIATPTGYHCAYALEVARAGKPCYVEKPMARSLEECRRMLGAFEHAGQKLFVAYYRRALPRFVRARQLVQDGRIGQLTGVAYRLTQPRHRKYTSPDNLEWRLDPFLGGAGQFLDLGCHTVDALDFICGPVDRVSGVAANLATPAQQTEDAVAMQMTFRCGALGSAYWNFAGQADEDWIVLTGTEGRVELSTFGTEPVRLTTADGSEEFAEPTPQHVQQPLIQTIVDELLGKGECPSTGVSAARTAAVQDAALESYYGPRAGDFWNHPDRWPGRQ